MRSLRQLLVTLRRFAGKLGPMLALGLVVAIFGIADYAQDRQSTFLSAYNIRLMAVHAAPIAVAALGMTIIIISGGIDLAAGTAMALSATVLAGCLDRGYSPGIAVPAALATGLLAGTCNGLLISTLGVVPFIITLGTMTIYRGLAKIIAGETTVRPPLAAVPAWMNDLKRPDPRPEWLIQDVLPNFAHGVWLALVLALVTALVLKYTVFGRWVFAVGSSEPTARLCGVNVRFVKIVVYALGGLFVGIAGIYQFSKLSAGNPTSGDGLELRIIAAVVIGGGSLSGGRGSVMGTLAGALMMNVIDNGCTMLGLRNPIQDILIGAIIVSAVTVDRWRQGKMWQHLVSWIVRQRGTPAEPPFGHDGETTQREVVAPP